MAKSTSWTREYQKNLVVIDFQGSNVSGYCTLHKGTIIKCVNRRVRAPDGVFSCDGDGIKTSGCVYVSLLLHFKGNILWLFDLHV